MRVPWTARRSNQSILKEINPEFSLEGLLLKLQCFGCIMRRANSLPKILMLGKDRRQKEKGVTEDEMVRWHHRLGGHEFEQTQILTVEDRVAWWATLEGFEKSWTRLSD